MQIEFESIQVYFIQGELVVTSRGRPSHTIGGHTNLVLFHLVSKQHMLIHMIRNNRRNRANNTQTCIPKDTGERQFRVRSNIYHQFFLRMTIILEKFKLICQNGAIEIKLGLNSGDFLTFSRNSAYLCSQLCTKVF